MPRWAGTTTARGLGHQHQALRAYKLSVLVDGTPCRRCGQPRYHPTRCPHGPCRLCRLDLGHDQSRALGGPHPQGLRELEHVRCNRSAGAKLGNQLRRQQQRRQRQHTRSW
jgi:hypothetical protein